MKKQLIQVVFLLFSLGIFLTSCGAGKLNSKAEESATAFYNSLQKKDYDAALGFCSDKAFQKESKNSWIKAFEKNVGLLGGIRSFTKTNGFNIQASTSTGTTVTLAYDVQWQYGKSQDTLFLVKEKDGSMKIYAYTWQHRGTTYLANLDICEKMAAEYMDAVKAKNYEAALAFCTDAALKGTPKEEWASFLENISNKHGVISGYKIEKDSSTYNIAGNGAAGKGNYYDVFVETDRNGNKVTEKLVFFQKDYESPIKLAGHNIL